MIPEHHLSDLLRFFKALGEPNRLKIVGLLARRAHTVEDLARQLGVGVSTVSHHLSLLSAAGLVAARAEGLYNLYSLRTEVLSFMARTILHEAEEPRREQRGELNTFEQRVMDTFTSPDGRITAFPVQEKKFLVLVRHALKAFEPGIKYTEKRVNQILKEYNEDTARLRRSLVEYKYMAREGGGGKYWRIDADAVSSPHKPGGIP
jgi:hypothetical protein